MKPSPETYCNFKDWWNENKDRLLSMTIYKLAKEAFLVGRKQFKQALWERDEWERAAHQWRDQYDKLKQKYEPEMPCFYSRIE